MGGSVVFEDYIARRPRPRYRKTTGKRADVSPDVHFYYLLHLLSYRRIIWSFSREKLNWTKEDKGLWRTLSTSPSYILSAINALQF
uniref:SFRICE_032666 n=1 Tax=Spodoptera frugiperda TaxID=7108 RepID=A0A2H1VQ68_SPOFR